MLGICRPICTAQSLALVSGIGMAPEATGRWRPLHRVRASVSRGLASRAAPPVRAVVARTDQVSG
jgi:hypothetical protein